MRKILFYCFLAIALVLASTILFRVELLRFAIPKVAAVLGFPLNKFEITSVSASQLSLAVVELELSINNTKQLIAFENIAIQHQLYSISKVSIGKISLANFNNIEISSELEVAGETFLFVITARDLKGTELNATGTFDSQNKTLLVNKISTKGELSSAISLADDFYPALADLQIVSGTFAGEGILAASISGISELKFSISVTKLGYKSRTSSATGIAAQIKLDTTTASSPVSTITAESLSYAGIDAQELAMHAQLSLLLPSNAMKINLKNASFKIWDGKVATSNLLLTPEQTNFETTLSIDKINIQKLLKDYPQEVVSATGTVSGSIPLRIEKEALLVKEAKLTAEPGGGVLQVNYDPNSLGANPSLLTMQEVLKNYHYQSLEALINLSADGDLQLGLALSGNNPSYENGRTVNLNFTIEENLPALFESLELKEKVEKSALDYLGK